MYKLGCAVREKKRKAYDKESESEGKAAKPGRVRGVLLRVKEMRSKVTNEHGGTVD